MLTRPMTGGDYVTNTHQTHETAEARPREIIASQAISIPGQRFSTRRTSMLTPVRLGLTVSEPAHQQ